MKYSLQLLFGWSSILRSLNLKFVHLKEYQLQFILQAAQQIVVLYEKAVKGHRAGLDLCLIIPHHLYSDQVDLESWYQDHPEMGVIIPPFLVFLGEKLQCVVFKSLYFQDDDNPWHYDLEYKIKSIRIRWNEWDEHYYSTNY